MDMLPHYHPPPRHTIITVYHTNDPTSRFTKVIPFSIKYPFLGPFMTSQMGVVGQRTWPAQKNGPGERVGFMFPKPQHQNTRFSVHFQSTTFCFRTRHHTYIPACLQFALFPFLLLEPLQKVHTFSPSPLSSTFPIFPPANTRNPRKKKKTIRYES